MKLASKNILRKWMIALSLCLALLVSGLVFSETFIEERERFREEIKNKQETQLDEQGLFYAVIFDKDQGKYAFDVSQKDAQRIKSYMSGYFNCTDQALLDKMLKAIKSGHFIIFKEYNDDGVNLKTIFISPEAKYWEWLTDANGIESLFHVYNFSVGLYSPGAERMHIMIQTQGDFFGISKAVTLPIWFEKNDQAREFSFKMPTQAEIVKVVNQMPPLKPGRDSLEEKFIDYCRTHSYFQQMDDGEYLIEDKDIVKLLERVILDKDEGCEVKETTGKWKVQDDFPDYMLVSYSLKTRVNIEALLPSFMRFAAGAVDKAAQIISDEVSVKYLPLSMKNFRDFTQEWTKNGPPE